MVPLLVCIAGIFLGLHFNVLILLPVSIIGGAVFIFADPGSGASYASMRGLLFGFFSLQGGYMLGLTGRDAYAKLLSRLNAIQSTQL